jgi:opacity protein-like surface antigen
MLFITPLLADEGRIYLGVSYLNVNEEFRNIDAKSSSNGAALKFGYGLRDAYAIEFSFEAQKNESDIFSLDDGDRYAVNIELLKAFDLDIYALPFIKAGFGAGYMKVDRELQEELNFGSFNFGAGCFLPLDDTFDLELAYSRKSISYESVDLASQTKEYKSDSNSIYLGLNARF